MIYLFYGVFPIAVYKKLKQYKKMFVEKRWNDIDNFEFNDVEFA